MSSFQNDCCALGERKRIRIWRGEQFLQPADGLAAASGEELPLGLRNFEGLGIGVLEQVEVFLGDAVRSGKVPGEQARHCRFQQFPAGVRRRIPSVGLKEIALGRGEIA